ncbi:hypothetical protein LCGC14_1435410, partial [marine sediment metagenome]
MGCPLRMGSVASRNSQPAYGYTLSPVSVLRNDPQRQVRRDGSFALY